MSSELERVTDSIPADSTVYIRDVPRHVKDQFKACCARRGETMTDAIVQFMRDCVADDIQNKVKRRRRSATHHLRS